MTKLKIGDLFSLKNHPYEKGITDVKISALANMTPPILVVSEIMNSGKEYDGETGDEKSKLVKCIFYSHKSNKFENYWFNINHIKPILDYNLQNLNEEVDSEKTKEINTSKDEDVKNAGITYSKSTPLEFLKNMFLNNQVILKSCEHELGKIKTTFIKTDNKSSNKINAHLDFLPPVLTVIDVKINDEKVIFNPKSGNQKKIISYFLLKCKWYNPLSSGFSEDFIPIETLQLLPKNQSLEWISELISDKKLIRKILKEPLKLDGGLTINHTYIQPIELVFNHYKYKLEYFDFFKNNYLSADLADVDINSETIDINDIIIDKIPEYKSDKQEFTSVKTYVFEKGKYYRITYKDLMDKISRRVIYVKEFVKDKVVIADCLLRQGDERHFRLKEGSILKIEELDSEYFI